MNPALQLSAAIAATFPSLPQAVCKNSPMIDEAWFPLDSIGPDIAKRICKEDCPELGKCREAILTKEADQGYIEWGVWGGLSEPERAALLKTRRRKERHVA